MKQFLLLALLGLSASLSHAQQANLKADGKRQHEQLQQTILAKQVAKDRPQAKTTATARRLTGTARYDGSTLTDSVRHAYRNFKGSSHPNENSYHSNSEYRREYFKAADPLAVHYIQSDTSTSYIRTSGGLMVRGKVMFDYDASGNLTHARHEDEDDTYEYFVTSNSNGSRATVIQRDSFGGNPYADNWHHYFVYDASGRIIKDSAEYISLAIPYYKADYSYNAAGFLDHYEIYYKGTSGWEPSNKGEFVYDGSNRLLSVTSSEDNGSGWELSGRITYTYTGSASQYTGSITQSYNGTAWEDYTGDINILNAAGQITQQYYLADIGPSPSLDTSYRVDYYYHPDGLFEHQELATYVGNGNFSTPDVFMYYYYEDYQTTGIADITAAKAFTIYPNPSAGTITLQLAKQPVQSVQVTITDMTGKVLNRVMQNTSAKQITLDYPDGVYLITVEHSGTIQTQKIILKKP